MQQQWLKLCCDQMLAVCKHTHTPARPCGRAHYTTSAAEVCLSSECDTFSAGGSGCLRDDTRWYRLFNGHCKWSKNIRILLYVYIRAHAAAHDPSALHFFDNASSHAHKNAYYSGDIAWISSASFSILCWVALSHRIRCDTRVILYEIRHICINNMCRVGLS